MNTNATRHSLETLPVPLKPLLQDYARDHTLSMLHSDVVDNCCRSSELTKKQLGLALLPVAASYAVTPISAFNVGAVVFDTSGNAYLGANFEFTDVDISQTIHAEQSAIANAWAQGASALSLLVVNYPPCGHCRQFMNELSLTDDFCIQLPERPSLSLADYLPEAFGPADLAINERLLNTQPPTLTDSHKEKDLSEMAKAACKSSHAPYSHCYSGVAVGYTDKDIVIGCYAENAAFNPSLPPLQMALNTRRLAGKPWADIEAVVMSEVAGSLSQRQHCQSLLDKVSPSASFSYQTIEATRQD